MLLGNCGWNSGWVKDCFGTSILDEIRNKNIICSGVSVGSFDKTMLYLSLMSAIILHDSEYLDPATQSQNPEILRLVQASRFPSCERNGVDQGSHNVIIHKGVLPGVTKWPQASSPVANMQAKVAKIKPNFEVVNSLDQKVAVVHQYDRFPKLQSYLFGKVC